MLSHEIEFVKLDPPQRKKKWIEFQEDDIESQLVPTLRRHSATGTIPIQDKRRHSSTGMIPIRDNSRKLEKIREHVSAESPLSSSMSSSIGSGSLGSAGEGSPKICPPAHYDLSEVPPRSSRPRLYSPARRWSVSPQAAVSFNKSFGGFSHTGAPVSIKDTIASQLRRTSTTMATRTNTTRTTAASPPPRMASVSSTESVGSSTTNSIRVSDVNELEDLEEKCSELVLGEEVYKYSPLENIRIQDGVYTGWSNLILGQAMGWSENIKSDVCPEQKEKLSNINSKSNGFSSGDHLNIPEYGRPVLLEAESSPDLPSLRQITWPRSPSRSFVRNFP